MSRARFFVRILMTLVACGCARKEAPVGYSGPLPSGPGQSAMKDLMGKTVKDAAGNEWTVKWFAVVPNDGSPRGLGPAVELERGGVKKHLPVESDGDAADLYRRVTGAPHPVLTGTPGKVYLEGWAKLK